MTARAQKIVVLDDEPVLVETVRLILENEGYEVHAHESGSAAVADAQTFCPDLLLADVVLQDMTGVDVAILLRQKCPTLKVLLFSGQTETNDVLEAARANGFNFPILAKPVAVPDLLKHVRHLLDGDHRASWA